MKKLVISAVLVMVTGSVLATTDMFTTLDVNQDKLISLEEASVDTTLTAIFADLDANQDGFLSKPEFSAVKVR